MSRRALLPLLLAALTGCPDAPPPEPPPAKPPAKTPEADPPAKTPEAKTPEAKTPEITSPKTKTPEAKPLAPRDDPPLARRKGGTLRPYAKLALEAPANVFEGDDIDLTVRLTSLLKWDLPDLVPLHGTAGAWTILVDPGDAPAEADRALDDRGHAYTGARFTLTGRGTRTFLRLLFGEQAGGWLEPGDYTLVAAYRSTPGQLDYKGRDRLDWKRPVVSAPVRIRVRALPKAQAAAAGAARRFLARGVERPLPELKAEARRLLAGPLRPSLARRVRRHVVQRMAATQRTPAQRKATIQGLEALLAKAPSRAEVDRYAVLLGDLHLQAGDEAKARAVLRRSTRVRAAYLLASLSD